MFLSRSSKRAFEPEYQLYSGRIFCVQNLMQNHVKLKIYE